MATARVLLVEDEGIIRLVTGDFLRDEGFEVIEATNGDEAARLLDGAKAFDVLFTDVQMPGRLDGIALVAHARLRRPAMPALVVSGYAANLANRLRELNPAAAFLSKPYNLAAVAEVLRRLAADS